MPFVFSLGSGEGKADKNLPWEDIPLLSLDYNPDVLLERIHAIYFLDIYYHRASSLLRWRKNKDGSPDHRGKLGMQPALITLE